MSIERSRLVVSQLCVALLVVIVAMSESVWIENELIEESLFAAALALTVIGSFGRIWCLAHIAGRKDSQLVTVGPYSLCRNPLYLFSLIGAVGIALSTCSLIIPALVTMAFLTLYASIIRSEERRLADAFGRTYETYQRCVPRFIPSLRAYVAADRAEVDLRVFARGLRDVAWFVVALFGAHLNIELHEAGYGITLFRIY